MADDNAISGKVSRMYAVSELLEVAVAVILVYSFLPIKKNWLDGALIAVLLLSVSVTVKVIDGARLKRVLKRSAAQDGHVMHVVTEHRLKTLQTVGAGDDIVEVLRLRLDMPPLRGDELVHWLEERLGRERVQEKIEIIRRYTGTTGEGLGQHQGERA